MCTVINKMLLAEICSEWRLINLEFGFSRESWCEARMEPYLHWLLREWACAVPQYVHILYIGVNRNTTTHMHPWIGKKPFDFQSLIQQCRSYFSKTCWNKQWHAVPSTPTSVQVPFPSALWLPALYPDKYTAPGCPAGLWGNEIQMPAYLWYHCPKPLP